MTRAFDPRDRRRRARLIAVLSQLSGADRAELVRLAAAVASALVESGIGPGEGPGSEVERPKPAGGGEA